MNKQVLTKTFSFSKWLLFFFFAVGLSLTSCEEDYDDDISGLKKEIQGLKDAYAKISDLQSTLNAVKTTADKAAADASATLTKAEAAIKDAGDAKTAADAAKKAAEDAKKIAEDAQKATEGIDPNAGAKADEALKTANDAMKKAEEALAAAGTGGGGDVAAVKAIADEALAKAKEALAAAATAKEEAIAAIEGKLETLEAGLQSQIDAIKGTGLTPAEIEEIVAGILASDSFKEQMAEIEANIGQMAGHRLTSIAVIPESHINGIAAITFKSLSYVPQKFVAHDSLGFVTEDAQKTAVTISSGNLVVKYHVNPSLGVRTSDVGEPSFDCMVSYNDMTRSVDPSKALVNSPIKPVEGTGKVEDGIYSVSVTKAITDNINREWLQVDGSYASEYVDIENERFYMASLALPISEDNWTDDEKAAFDADGTVPTVNSEYVRIAETTVTPFIKQAGSTSDNGNDDVYDDSGTAPDIYPELNEQDVNGKWIHFHDSAALYMSANTQLVDKTIDWSKPFDLKTLVDVCILEQNHASLDDWASYGLEYRFYLPTKPYYQGVNKTDQQQFAKIDSPTSGMISSKVYTIDGIAQTAEGREPIVRAELWDKTNKKLVAIRYIKLKWGKEPVPATPIELNFGERYISCDTTQMRVYTQAMNEDFYYAIKSQYGYSKEDFHAIYKTLEIVSLTQDTKDITNVNNVGEAITHSTYIDGVVPADNYSVGLIPDETEVTSYNIVWTMDEMTEGKLDATDGISDYVLKFLFKSSSGGNNIDVTFKVALTVPAQKFWYQGTYWSADAQPSQSNPLGGGVFKVNPIVYDTPKDGLAGAMTDYSHIEADMVTGWINGTSQLMPSNVAQFIQMIRGCAEVKYIFDKDRLKNYTYLNGYEVTADGLELWKGTPGTSTISTGTSTAAQDAAPVDQYEYIQEDAMAASISNAFGTVAADRTEAKYALPWNDKSSEDGEPYISEDLGSGVNEAKGVIRLHETTELLGTSAAITLVGQKVPVNLVVKYNNYNEVAVQKFEVLFINPLTMDGAIKGAFVDAKVNGSYLDAQEGLTFTDWNAYKVANKPSDPTLANEKERFTADLWDYYAVNTVQYDVTKIKTNLELKDGILTPTAGVTTGPLPTVVSIKQVNIAAGNTTGDPANGYEEVTADPQFLGYFNNNGTPVNLDYQLFIPVSVNYKWGNMNKTAVSVSVSKAGGI